MLQRLQNIVGIHSFRNRFVGIDAGRHLHIIGGNAAGDAVNHHILHIGDLFKLFFQFFRRQLFAVFEDDQVLFPAGDIQEAILMQLAQVAGFEPFSAHRLCGQFGLLIVSHHHILTPDPDLAIDDLHLAVSRHQTHRVELEHLISIDADERGAFGNTIALNHQ